MPVSTRRRRLRWGAPFVVFAAIGLIALVPTLSASATPSLPPITPQQLLVKARQADVQALSGTIRLTANLGIPDLSALGGVGPRGSGFDPVSLLSGAHEARIWVDGPDRQRIALPSSLAESDVVHNGSDVWTWQSSGSKVTHLQGVAAHAGSAASAPAAPGTTAPHVETPAQLAGSLLARLDPSTVVTVPAPVYVAGHKAYVLDLAPRSGDSTVDHVALSVDAGTGLVLKVAIFAKGQTAEALGLGFSSVRFARPAASAFRFTPPPGAKVTTRTVGADAGGGTAVTPGERPTGVAPDPAAPSTAERPQVLGRDWTSVVIVPSTSAAGPLPPAAYGILRAATPVSGSWGSGRLLHTSLVNVLLLDDGRVAVGAVTPAALERAVGSTH